MQFVGRLDSVVGSFGLLGALAALVERAETGTGQHVEVSAAEAVTSLLGAPMLEYLLTGRVAGRTGNRVPDMAPHGCYPCAGADEWIAIAVATDEQWRALCTCMGRPELGGNPRYAGLANRKAAEDELDRLVEAWTAGEDPFTAADRLQRAGVPAVASMRPDHLFHDPHLQARAAWVRFDHPVQGERFDLRLPWLFSDGDCRYGPAPLFGQHNADVYEGLLGLSAADVAALEEDGVIA
jgi:crotonobetainyl-CoA:carnitine CoA-transferase CaiB-like acyl-CoA transferase